MKKSISFLFLFIYSFTSIGATVHMHYCMNKFVGVSLHYNKGDKCSRCGMKNGVAKGCCKDEQKPIKTDKEHQLVKCSNFNCVTIFSPAEITPVYSFNEIFSSLISVRQNINITDSSPDDPVPIYILNCNYRI